MQEKSQLAEKNYKQSLIVVIVIFALSLFISHSSYAQGDLLLYPKRILFEGTKRSQEINLANSGKDTARYIISVVQIRMKEDGAFEMITEPDPDQHFADKYFRIYPRNVVLPPNEAQTVKIQLANTGDMKPGEYRSHLYVRAEDEKKPLGEEEAAKEEGGISVKLKAIFGITIPVIIRSGENDSKASLSNVQFFEDNEVPPSLKFTFNREGNMSVYGDVTVDYISPEGKTTRVGTANGISVYTPTNKRNFTMPLFKNSGIDYHKGSLVVSYKYNGANPNQISEEKIELR